MIGNYDSVDVSVRVKVGTSEHHAGALNRVGKAVFETVIPNDEARMRAVLYKLKRHSSVLIIVEPERHS